MLEILAYTVNRKDLLSKAVFADPVSSGRDPAGIETLGIDLTYPALIAVTGCSHRNKRVEPSKKELLRIENCRFFHPVKYYSGP
jgi:hypothetical protein